MYTRYCDWDKEEKTGKLASDTNRRLTTARIQKASEIDPRVEWENRSAPPVPPVGGVVKLILGVPSLGSIVLNATDLTFFILLFE